MNFLANVRSAIRGFRSDQSGVTAPVIAIMFTGLVGMAGYAIDMGRVMWVQRQLQSAADAAALAGALEVADSATNGRNTALSYGGSSGQLNQVAGASSVNTTAAAGCLTSTWVVPACGDTTSKMNSITVSETATVPTYFLKIFGVNNFTPNATAKASAKGGSGTVLNVMVVLDTTASMNTADPNCSGEVPNPSHPGQYLSNPTKIQCAKVGAQNLLTGLNSLTSKVGFMTYPPVDSQGVTNDTTCNGGTLGGSGRTGGNVEPYKNVTVSSTSYNPGNSGTYTLADLGGTSATIAQTLVGSNSNCTGQGIQAVGGVQTYFADAITAAQYVLKNSPNASTSAQNVIILLSDGDAGANASNLAAGKYDNQCQQAVTAAQAAASAGTWVFTIAYGANSAGAPPPNPAPTTNGKTGNQLQTTTTTYSASNAGCPTDNPSLSPCNTMKNMASSQGALPDPSKFYSDGASSSNTVTTTTTVQDYRGNTVGNPTKSTSTTSGTCSGQDASHTISDIAKAFKAITGSLTQPRLVPNGTT